VHSRWGVALHTDGVKDHDSQSSSPSSELQAVKEQGEALCSRLMPKVPIPKPLHQDTATEGTSRPSAWIPPRGQHTLAYLFELLNMITGLLSVLETAKIDLPHLLPVDALQDALQQVRAPLSEKNTIDAKKEKKKETCPTEGLFQLFSVQWLNASNLSVYEVILMRCGIVPPLQQSLGNSSSSSSSSSHQPPRWRHCATSRRIPFEPAIDRESGALFLGGGMGIAAAPKGVLCRKRQQMVTPVQRKWHVGGTSEVNLLCQLKLACLFVLLRLSTLPLVLAHSISHQNECLDAQSTSSLLSDDRTPFLVFHLNRNLDILYLVVLYTVRCELRSAGTCGVVVLSLRLPTSKLQQSLDQATAAIAPQAEVFLHQVCICMVCTG